MATQRASHRPARRTATVSRVATTHDLYNPGDTPVVFDEAGHQIGGGEHRTADPLDVVTARHIAAGRLIDLDAKD